MIKRLLLLTAIFGFAVSCNDYEDDFANLNDQLNGVNAKLDNIQNTVDGIADIQLEYPQWLPFQFDFQFLN